MEAVNYSGIYADNNYWGSPNPQIYADGTSWILAREPLESDPNPGTSCGFYKSVAANEFDQELISDDISDKYWEAISKLQQKDFSAAKLNLLSIINGYFDNKYSPLALLAFYDMKLKNDNSSINDEFINLLDNLYKSSTRNPLKPFALRLLAREAALSNNYTDMVKYNIEVVNNYPNSSNELTALFDLVNYYNEIENDFEIAAVYLKRMKDSYSEEDLTLFARINLGEKVNLYAKGSKENENNVETHNSFYFGKAYPNPFNPATTITYGLPNQSKVQLKIYDILGREVAELVNETKEGGRYSVEFNGSKLASGLYIVTLRINDLEHGQTFTKSQKLLMTK